MSFVESLIRDCGVEGTVLVYNQSFEKSRLNELIRDFPIHRDGLEAILSRVKDLNDPFKQKDYYLPDMRGSSSIKVVLPAIDSSVSYEELTSGLEGECRKILAYCDLPWEDACLDFHRNAAPSMTASLAQVRQPVYTSSIGRWRNYRNELQPLDKRFREAGLDF